MILLHDFIFVFIPCFFGLVLEKMEHRKNVVKNGGISWAYRELSIEGVFKPLHIMLWTWTKVPWAISDKYSVSVSWAFGGFFYLLFRYTVVNMEQCLSPDINHWPLRILEQGWVPKPVWLPSVVWAENILIRSLYLNPVGYSLNKTLSMGIAHPLHLIPSLVFLF